MIAGPPASETTATRSPRGMGCKANAIARSNSSSIEFARSTPVWENTASAARSEPPKEPVCETAARLRSEEHTSELHHANISYAVFCLKKKNGYTHYSQSTAPELHEPTVLLARR